MTTTQIALRRLATLGCEKLPRQVKEQIVKDFLDASAFALIKLADKSITPKTIATAFVTSFCPVGSGVDYLDLPTAELNETKHVAGTNNS